MKTSKNFTRKAHFLGTKVRNLRKANNLTLEELSMRCVKIDVEAAPSVSYLSMIERDKRVPSAAMLAVIAEVFQRPVAWFLDDAHEAAEVVPEKGTAGGIKGMALEPNFLFSKDILQIAIPELLNQTGTSGRQFAQLLIRVYQEHHRNHFPDLERAAEEVGKKMMPQTPENLLAICKSLGLKVKWFKPDKQENAYARSYFEPPHTIYLNEGLKADTVRLKFDLAVNIGHQLLHQGDGEKSVLLSSMGTKVQTAYELTANNILHAWRDFECSFFAGALLCPRVPFRQLLDRCSYELEVAKLAGVSTAVAMRRMTAVCSYPHWHYFDAYSQGNLKAVYRGNGIALPWGSMSEIENPCQHWSVFRMVNSDAPVNDSVAQISVVLQEDKPHIYCCESVKVLDFSGRAHVLCSGVDLNPALQASGHDAFDIAGRLHHDCEQGNGNASIAPDIGKLLLKVGRILNIGWIARGIERDAQLICQRGSVCSHQPVDASSEIV
ncbi:MAG: MerR family transcriptional regulator [Gammaproteobacteria bacterium]|nr:MAG: MerR family transcriptional regulator [Gammaproteobacteria bacterium]